MKAIAQVKSATPSDVSSLSQVELPDPAPAGRDLLVRVKAVSVNPVDTKVRRSRKADATEPRVLGWDAAGIVEAVGGEASEFRPGEEVYYAGDITRPGSNAELQLVDERLVGRKPERLSFAQAAALPLTLITAWEALFHRLGLSPSGANAGTILVIGGAGGVGSILIQLAKRAGLTVIATASRPETTRWVRELGADHVIDHRDPLPTQLATIGFDGVDFIANLADTDAYWHAMAGMIRPQGAIVCIVENSGPLDLNLLKSKSATFVWEFMFTRSMYRTSDMARQGALLNEAAALLDAGALRSTLCETLSPITAESVREAHRRLESGRSIGKLVLEGWS